MHSAIQRLINLQWVQCSWHISAKFKCLCSNANLVVRPKSLKWKCVGFFSSLLNYELWGLYPCIFLSRWGPACSSDKTHGLCWYFPVRQFPSSDNIPDSAFCCIRTESAPFWTKSNDAWKRRADIYCFSFHVFNRFWYEEFQYPPQTQRKQLAITSCK